MPLRLPQRGNNWFSFLTLLFLPWGYSYSKLDTYSLFGVWLNTSFANSFLINFHNRLQCEDYRSKCQEYFNVLGIKDGAMAPLCEKAEYCSCGAEDQHVKFVIDEDAVAPPRSDYDGDTADAEIKLNTNFTVGLYSECKCNFWSRLCEDTGVGEACDIAAEYCCGDHGYSYPDPDSDFASIVDAGFVIFDNSPACYCDFSRYAKNEFGHAFELKTLNVSNELQNPCAQLFSSTHDEERASLEAIYENTNGEIWTENDGWMNEAVDHCEWYGISCDDEGRVTGIDLRDNNLAGQFPVYTATKRNTTPSNNITSLCRNP